MTATKLGGYHQGVAGSPAPDNIQPQPGIAPGCAEVEDRRQC
jgi:hypothetical protein